LAHNAIALDDKRAQNGRYSSQKWLGPKKLLTHSGALSIGKPKKESVS